MNCRFIGTPESYPAWLGLEGLPAESMQPLDFVHLFSNDPVALERELRDLLTELAPTGRIWVSWYKKRSYMGSALTEDRIRQICLPMGLVDIKVCSIDRNWSGLMLVIRRSARRTPGAS